MSMLKLIVATLAVTAAAIFFFPDQVWDFMLGVLMTAAEIFS